MGNWLSAELEDVRDSFYSLCGKGCTAAPSIHNQRKEIYTRTRLSGFALTTLFRLFRVAQLIVNIEFSSHSLCLCRVSCSLQSSTHTQSTTDELLISSSFASFNISSKNYCPSEEWRSEEKLENQNHIRSWELTSLQRDDWTKLERSAALLTHFTPLFSCKLCPIKFNFHLENSLCAVCEWNNGRRGRRGW